VKKLRIVCIQLLLLGLVPLGIAGSASAGTAHPATTRATAVQLGPAPLLRGYLRKHIDHPRKLSQGARAWLLGAQLPDGEFGRLAPTPSFGSNVDANDPTQDLLGGQSETAIAAAGAGRVMTAWNDATFFLSTTSTDLTSSGTGVGYSNDGGATFTDLTGIPNDNPNQQWSGDPTVVAIDDHHFIVGSLYYPGVGGSCREGPAYATVAVSVATVEPGGATVTFGDPVIAGTTLNLCRRRTRRPQSALDKDFLAYDPTSRTLAISYTRFMFGNRTSGLGQIEVRRATVPADPATLSETDFTRAVVVWGEESYCSDSSEATGCGSLNEGAYPAVAPNGDVYVAWERNILSNVFFGLDPRVYIHAAYVPAGAEIPATGGRGDPIIITRGQANATPSGGVKGMDNVFIAGYSRGFGQDFPRIAYNAVDDEVVVVWNDASAHPLGDIWLRVASTGLGTLSPIRQVNDDTSYALHFLPAVSIGSDGSIRTSWYDRRLNGADSTQTDYFGEIRAAPATNAADFRITTGSTDWAGTSTVIDPNFGDYTDNATTGTTTYYTWSDGRVGVPQPFVDASP
jgi:hypothetical protein